MDTPFQRDNHHEMLPRRHSLAAEMIASIASYNLTLDRALQNVMAAPETTVYVPNYVPSSMNIAQNAVQAVIDSASVQQPAPAQPERVAEVVPIRPETTISEPSDPMDAMAAAARASIAAINPQAGYDLLRQGNPYGQEDAA